MRKTLLCVFRLRNRIEADLGLPHDALRDHNAVIKRVAVQELNKQRQTAADAELGRWNVTPFSGEASRTLRTFETFGKLPSSFEQFPKLPERQLSGENPLHRRAEEVRRTRCRAPTTEAHVAR